MLERPVREPVGKACQARPTQRVDISIRGLCLPLDNGWIVPAAPGSQPVSAREIRAYALTERGRQIFHAEQERMAARPAAAQSRLVEGAV